MEVFQNPVHFTTQLEVRIGDINYGGHLGNDKVLSWLRRRGCRCFGLWDTLNWMVKGLASS